MFLLDVVKTLSVYSMDTLRYKSEIVRDSLTPQDILIMQKLEDLKSCRRHWEREFSDVVTSVGANSEVLRGNLTDCGLSKVNQKSYAGKQLYFKLLLSSMRFVIFCCSCLRNEKNCVYEICKVINTYYIIILNHYKELNKSKFTNFNQSSKRNKTLYLLPRYYATKILHKI